MRSRSYRNAALGVSISALLVACGSQPTETTDLVDTDSSNEQRDTELLSVGGTLFNIPSPAQSAFLLKQEGLAYQKDRTVALEKGEAATARGNQAALMGMLGADMAYVTVYSDGQRAMATLQAIEKIANKLQLSNAFDRTLLERFRNNLSSEDSLLQFSGAAFRSADQYLKNDEQHDLSAMVLLGGWVESMHLALVDPKTAGNKNLMARVGAQKTTVDGLEQLVDAHMTGDMRPALLSALKDLRASYEGVVYEYTYEKPVTDVAARTTYINSTSTVSITEDQLQAIAAKVAALRNLILA